MKLRQMSVTFKTLIKSQLKRLLIRLGKNSKEELFRNASNVGIYRDTARFKCSRPI